MLINLSNHPSTLWSEEQKFAASHYGEVVDLPFPVVDPTGDEDYIANLADNYFEKIKAFSQNSSFSDIAVHLMGEITLTYALLQRLQDLDIISIASTTERRTVEYPGGKKESQFQFVQFRKYY